MAVTIKKMIENAARMIVSAISLGVFCREAPSTRAIIRSRKLSPAPAVTADHDPVGEHPRSAGHARPVAAGLADHRCALAGDRRLVDRGHPLDDLAVGRNDLADLDHHAIAGLELGRGDLGRLAGRLEPVGDRVLTRGPQALRLGLAARLGQGLGEVGEEHGQEQQDRQRALVDDQARGRTGRDRLDRDERGQDPAGFDQEHDGVAGHVARVEHQERAAGGHLHQGRLEQIETARLATLQFQGLDIGLGSVRQSCRSQKGHREDLPIYVNRMFR